MQISEKGYGFLFGRMYFTGNNSSQNILIFTPMLRPLTLDSNKKGTKWILIGISPEKIKPFDTNFEPTMSNLTNGTVISKFNISVLERKNPSSLYSNFILNLYIVYKLNN